ncbi:electron transporter RsxE [candidate division TA06 bacterium DG_78]|uniref:Ion-translocating oxidoreductase complex subunit E n=1 Tax=candidate division TA06 bacterium DG_78 TaxID=1703772 RepID=A0A0S7YIL1_UNCT6|nr:MAG: electron transporter RsxE [candidate division TA06 bacterium DG_78]
MNKWQIFTRGLVKENAVLILMIGLCPALATSGTVRDGFGMGLAATFVLLFSNIIISIMRKRIPHEVRIPIFILIISTFVTIIDYFMQAYQPDLYRALGVFVPLIVVNCMILGRAEAYASKNSVINSALDGLGVGLGFTLTLTVIGAIREMLGSGTLLGVAVFGEAFKQSPVIFMILPPGAFLVIGVLKALINKYVK